MSGAIRDERAKVVEDTSYRLAYLFIAFALLLDVMYRSFMRHEAPWELLAIIIIAGAISTVYQGSQRTLTRHSARLFLVTLFTAGVVAAAIVASRLLR